jgi:hypothetical protein
MYTAKYFKTDSRYKQGRRLVHQQDYNASSLEFATFQQFEQYVQKNALLSGWTAEAYKHHVPRGNLITG